MSVVQLLNEIELVTYRLASIVNPQERFVAEHYELSPLYYALGKAYFEQEHAKVGN